MPIKRLAWVVAITAATSVTAGAIAATAARNRVAPIVEVFTSADGKRELVEVWLDPDTSCLYLIRGDTIIPRLGSDGRPLCQK